MRKDPFLLPGLKAAHKFAGLLAAVGFDRHRVYIAHEDRAQKYQLNDLNFFKQSDTTRRGERDFAFGFFLTTALGFLSFNLLAAQPAGSLTTVVTFLIVLGVPAWLGSLIRVSNDNDSLEPHQDHLKKAQQLFPRKHLG